MQNKDLFNILADAGMPILEEQMNNEKKEKIFSNVKSSVIEKLNSLNISLEAAGCKLNVETEERAQGIELMITFSGMSEGDRFFSLARHGDEVCYSGAGQSWNIEDKALLNHVQNALDNTFDNVVYSSVDAEDKIKAAVYFKKINEPRGVQM